jgi:hypothetical protein
LHEVAGRIDIDSRRRGRHLDHATRRDARNREGNREHHAGRHVEGERVRPAGRAVGGRPAERQLVRAHRQTADRHAAVQREGDRSRAVERRSVAISVEIEAGRRHPDLDAGRDTGDGERYLRRIAPRDGHGGRIKTRDRAVGRHVAEHDIVGSDGEV